MGTAFSIDVRDPGDWTAAMRDVVALLHGVDAMFSTYLPDSELSRFRSGRLRLGDAHPDLSSVLDLCAQLQEETSGYFTARWRDGIDPTGVVKGWAIERASLLLRSYGSHNHGVNGGGDVQLAGEAEPGRAWQVAIADPHAQGQALAVVPGRDLAVATSGTAERGSHIVNPFTGRPPAGLASVTVLGASLTRADAYATAAFAMGERAIAWLETMPGYEGLAVTSDGTVITTSRWPVKA